MVLLDTGLRHLSLTIAAIPCLCILLPALWDAIPQLLYANHRCSYNCCFAYVPNTCLWDADYQHFDICCL